MKQFIQQKLDELEILENPILHRGVNIHIYELIKKGRGWSVVSYRWNNNGRMDPYEDDDVIDNLTKGYLTLSQLKKSYSSDDLKFVIDGNLFAPSKLFQVIIECDEKQRFDILNTITKKSGEAYTCLLNYNWLDEIPLDKIKELLSY